MIQQSLFLICSIPQTVLLSKIFSAFYKYQRFLYASWMSYLSDHCNKIRTVFTKLPGNVCCIPAALCIFCFSVRQKLRALLWISDSFFLPAVLFLTEKAALFSEKLFCHRKLLIAGLFTFTVCVNLQMPVKLFLWQTYQRFRRLQTTWQTFIINIILTEKQYLQLITNLCFI